MSWTKHGSLAFLSIIIGILQIAATLGGIAPKFALISAVLATITWIVILTRHHPLTSTLIFAVKSIIFGSIFALLLIWVFNTFLYKPQKIGGVNESPPFIAAPLRKTTSPEKIATLDRGDKCYNDKEYQCAIDAYTEIIQSTEGDYPDAYFGLCKVYAAQGTYNQAISNCTLAINEYPRHQSFQYRYSLEEAFRERGEAYQNAGLRDYAISDYLNTLEITINYDIRQDILYRLNKLGTVPPYYIEGVYHDINRYTDNITNNPSNYNYYYNRGIKYYITANYYSALKDYDKAIELYRAFLLTNPQQNKGFLVHVYHERATLHREIGSKDKAIDDLTKALDIGYAPGITELVIEDLQKLGVLPPEGLSTPTH